MFGYDIIINSNHFEFCLNRDWETGLSLSWVINGLSMGPRNFELIGLNGRFLIYGIGQLTKTSRFFLEEKNNFTDSN